MKSIVWVLYFFFITLNCYEKTTVFHTFKKFSVHNVIVASQASSISEKSRDKAYKIAIKKAFDILLKRHINNTKIPTIKIKEINDCVIHFSIEKETLQNKSYEVEFSFLFSEKKLISLLNKYQINFKDLPSKNIFLIHMQKNKDNFTFLHNNTIINEELSFNFTEPLKDLQDWKLIKSNDIFAKRYQVIDKFLDRYNQHTACFLFTEIEKDYVVVTCWFYYIGYPMVKIIDKAINIQNNYKQQIIDKISLSFKQFYKHQASNKDIISSHIQFNTNINNWNLIYNTLSNKHILSFYPIYCKNQSLRIAIKYNPQILDLKTLFFPLNLSYNIINNF